MGGARAALFLLVAAVLCIQAAAVTDPTQQQALIDFKNKVVNKTRIESWNKTGDACADKWVGITCDAAKRNIIEINLTFFNLTVNGIPATLNNLIKCQNFMLNGNIIKGHLPLLNKCVALKIFRVRGGQLSGAIPANFLASNSKPEVINLSNNRLSSLIPKSLFQFPSLMTMDLSGNRLNGQLPSMSKLTKITLFLVGDNQISGNLLNDVKTANLVNFNASYNRLSGQIPLVLTTNTPNLVTLDLSHNRLSGNIPQNLFKSSKVQVPIMIVLANNSLTGKLPDIFVATIQALDSDQNRVNSLIDLSGNNLGGVVPKALLGSHSYVLFLDGNPKLVIPAVPMGPPPGAPSEAPIAAPQPPSPTLPPAEPPAGLPSPVASPTALPSPPPPAFAGPTPAPLGAPTTTASAPSPAAPPVGAAAPPPLVVGTPTSSPAAAPVTSFPPPPPPLLIALPPARAPTVTPFPPPLASGPAVAPATSPSTGGALPPPPRLRFEPPAPPPTGGDAAAFPAQFCLMLAVAVLSSTMILL